MAEKATYLHGHHAAVVSSHARRTVHNSAAFLLPYLQPHHRILDLGCGPGSITTGLAKLVPDGSVIGGDAVEDVLNQARELAKQEGISNIEFQRVDGNALPYGDGEFDICYAHQLLQHVGDPVAVLKEMRRVTKKFGVVAGRDADYQCFTWYPEAPQLDQWKEIYCRAARINGGEPDAGRHLKSWASKAGFASEDVTFSWDFWNYTGDDAASFSQSWKHRSLHSGFATTSIKEGFATQDVVEGISKAWDDWGKQDDIFLIIPNGQILCHVR